VRQAAQTWLPAAALNAPSSQLAHVRSVLEFGALSMYCPAAHGRPTSWHALPSWVVENILPLSHAPHVRSAVEEPVAVSPSPGGHVRHAVQASLPRAALNVLARHVVHSRSDDTPAGVVSYVPSGQVVVARHTRSSNAVGALKVYCPPGHVSLCVLQSRSEDTLGALFSNSPPPHVATGLQASPLVASENVVPATHAAHRRFCVLEPAREVPEPVGHVSQSVQPVSPAVAVNVPCAQKRQSVSAPCVPAAFW